MTLVTGMKLGPYEIVAPLGAGGMGEVYRARDTRLERTVAIKVLPSHLADNPELRQRFEREARAVSSLNHPHICALYDIGRQEGVDYLVLEYLEGETLANRLQKGALPLEAVLKTAIEVADALDNAHRQGVIHRDLKPGNVMLTKSGTKLLDFGLAKLRPAGPGAAAQGLSALPTENRELTGAGTLLGTFQYMSPEQLEGGEADARTDIFAFGALVYEMATGRKAFSGKSQASLISAIMNSDPPAMSALQPMTPPALEHVVKKCLAKDPDDRWQTARDLTLELKWVADGASQAGISQPALAHRRNRERLAWGLLAAAMLSAVALMFPAAMWLTRTAVPEPAKMIFQLEGPKVDIPILYFSLSPDGRHIVMPRSTADGRWSLWHRALDMPEGGFLRGTETGVSPFWSPDSRHVAFFVDGNLKKVDLLGSPPEPIGSASGRNPQGAWSGDGTILFGGDPGSNRGPLYRISSSGGKPETATKLDTSLQETAHTYPCFLPDGRHFLYLALSMQSENQKIYVSSIDSGDRKPLMRSDSQAFYSPPGYLLFLRSSALMAQRFDIRRFELQGEPFPIAQPVSYYVYHGSFSISNNGILAYRSGGDFIRTQLAWVDRGGRLISNLGLPGNNQVLMLSPEGDRVAVTRKDESTSLDDIWIIELATGAALKFTSGLGNNNWPVWSPDGSRIVFASDRDGGLNNLYMKGTASATQEERLWKSGRSQVPTSWSPDGRYILYQNDADLFVYPLSGDPKPYVFPGTPKGGRSAQFSPDGRWVAYASAESGTWEIYVQTFPASGGKWRISTAGGASPFWRRDGKELFFWGPEGDLIALDVLNSSTDKVFKMGKPHALFRRSIGGLTWGRMADISPDGQRFLVNSRVSDAASGAINIVLNWTAGLKK